MTVERLDSGPWYHYFWPWFIVVLLGSTVVAGISTVFIAVRGADPLVADDYYRDGKAINRTFAADREAVLREAHARVRIDDGVSIELEILGELPEELTLELSHVTLSKLDRRLRLQPTSTGHYATSAAPPAGPFYLSLHPAGEQASWRLRRRVDLPSGRDFLFELEPAE
jgi:hypothetical protein